MPATMIRQLLAAILAAGLSLAPRAGHTNFVDGNRLYALCVSTDIREFEWCTGYIAGVIDDIEFGQTVMHEPVHFCLPSNATDWQVRDVVITALRDYPQIRHFNAVTVIEIGLGRAFPCQ